MHWTKGLLAPQRMRLRATASPAGALAAGLLYRERRHRALAWASQLSPAPRGDTDSSFSSRSLVSWVPV